MLSGLVKARKQRANFRFARQPGVIAITSDKPTREDLFPRTPFLDNLRAAHPPIRNRAASATCCAGL
jgi:hypothetical protein